MVVSLYTSRITLELLGIDDFGVYNVVGGLVTLFAFLSRTLTASFNRFICIGIAKDDENEINHIVGASLLIQLAIILFVFLTGESLGVWYINNYLVISPAKLKSAHIVFQFSVATFIANLFTSTYNSIIVSYERMSVYAYICIFEVLSKLALVFALSISDSNRLAYYSAYMFGVQAVVLLIYILYVKKSFPSIKPIYVGAKTYIYQMLSFAGFGFVGSFAFVAKNQGLNLLLNLFGGPALNAARAISFQVYTAVYNFVGNFQTAFSPYILKKQELDNDSTCNHDVGIFTTISFAIMSILIIPLIFFVNPILHLWLGNNIPEYTTNFTILILLIGVCEAISSPLQNIIYGSGNIRSLQIGSFLVQFIVLFFSYVLLKNGYEPSIIYVIDLIFNILLVAFRIFIAAKVTSLNPKYYMVHTMLPIILTIALCYSMYLITPDLIIFKFGGIIICECFVIGLSLKIVPKPILQSIVIRIKNMIH